LMQVVAQEGGQDWARTRPTQEQLLDPTFNLDYGISMFSALLTTNNGDVRKTLAEYYSGNPDTTTPDAQQYLAAYDAAVAQLGSGGAVDGGTVQAVLPQLRTDTAPVSEKMAAYVPGKGTTQPTGTQAAAASAAYAKNHLGPRNLQYQYQMSAAQWAALLPAEKARYGNMPPFTTPLRGAGSSYRGGGGGWGGGGGGGVSVASLLKKLSAGLRQQLMLYFNGAVALEAGALAELARLGITDPEKLRPLFAQPIAPPVAKASTSSSAYWRSW